MEIDRKMPFNLSGARILDRDLQGKMHMGISQEPFCVEIYRKNAAHCPPTSIEHRACNPYRKNPFSVATLFGEFHGTAAIF